MKAWVLEDINEFTYREDVAQPEPAADEVLVKVKAAGICGSDIPRAYVSGAHKKPLIIGHEFSGEVLTVGADVDDKWKGRRVGIFPLIPCKTCAACRSKNYEMCSQYSYLGSRSDGGFAEYVAVPAWNLLELPEEVSFEQAAMLEPMAVAVHAIRQLERKQEDRVVVCGLGTIGQLVLMFLLERGMTNVYAIGSKEIQRKTVTAMGLSEDRYFDIHQGAVRDWLMEKTGGQGADAYFECVGRNETVSQAMELTAPKGRICLVGNPYGDMNLSKSVYWKILRQQLTIRGTWNSSFYGAEDEEAAKDDWHEVLRCLAAGRIHPEKLITHRFSLKDLDRGMQLMRDKSEEYIKVMGMFE